MNKEVDFCNIGADCSMVEDADQVHDTIAETVVLEALINGMGKLPVDVRERQREDHAKMFMVL